MLKMYNFIPVEKKQYYKKEIIKEIERVLFFDVAHDDDMNISVHTKRKFHVFTTETIEFFFLLFFSFASSITALKIT